MPVRITAIVGGLTLAAACQLSSRDAAAGRPPHAVVALAVLTDSDGNARGNARLVQDAAGILHVEIRLTGMAPGLHGVHFHAVGRCDGVAFATAGGHFNPGGKAHGLVNPAGPHAGDLPNLVAGPAGSGTLTESVTRVSLTGANGLLDADGAAVIVHAAADDEMTDPSGNSGARVACGVLRRAGGTGS
jgi:Cu-Zn family superoxide dismutase